MRFKSHYTAYSPIRFDTSGCIVYAKHFLSHIFLQHQLINKSIERIYSAICYGQVLLIQGTINKRIGRNRHIVGKYLVSPTGKEAITHYWVIKSNH